MIKIRTEEQIASVATLLTGTHADQVELAETASEQIIVSECFNGMLRSITYVEQDGAIVEAAL